MGKEAKTNAMRILERAKVAYTAHEYPHEEGVAVDGVTVAASMGEDPACVYIPVYVPGKKTASAKYIVQRDNLLLLERQKDMKVPILSHWYRRYE